MVAVVVSYYFGPGSGWGFGYFEGIVGGLYGDSEVGV